MLHFNFNSAEEKIPVDNPPDSLMTVSITKFLDSYRKRGEEISSAHVLAASQQAWYLQTSNHADRQDYILAYDTLPDGRCVVVGVFKRLDNYSFQATAHNEKRFYFLGEPAAKEVQERYLGKLLPSRKQGEANPVHFYDKINNN